jgi:polar amino acid transport system ATP-binding protein
MNDVILKLDSVVKRFNDNEVLRDISLELRRHEVVCLIGASGSGKSTLLRCVNLLDRIDGGEITLFGQSLMDPRIDSKLVRRHIGIVFQSYNLFPHLSVLDNIVLGPVKAQKRKRDEVREEAMVLLERIGLKERADDYPERLSGGQQQRVAIVRSLAMKPAILLLDEVTSALDPTLVGEVLDLLTELAHQGMTMLIATHEMSFARDVAHEVAYLDQGVLVEKGTPAEIFTSPREESTKNFLSRVH